MSGVNEIRSAFLDFFGRNGHTIVPSGPLVPRNDPTLMFTNAGMVQFKNVFTGLEQRPYSRAATSQKCVRAGGKHNDLDNVGYTARHHTFFEMLGNFSFGDYFKDEAIALAWTLITKEFGLAADRLTVTVYHTDDEAAALWRKIAGLPEEPHHPHRRPAIISGRWATPARAGRARRSSTTMARASPAGRRAAPMPTATGSSRSGTSSSCSSSSSPKDERVALPRPSIDTGMGLERIAAVLQGVHDNYDIDLFRTLIRASEEATGVPAEGRNRASHRVIADHLSASSFLIADGVLPANEGRGYVLSRIMRRAMRHAQLLGAEQPLMWRLVPVVVREMGQAYPELVRGEALIAETLKLEERRFRKTLARGLSLLADASRDLAAGRGSTGETAVRALRHLRLSARPDRRMRCASAASASTMPASTPPWPASGPRRGRIGRAPARRRPRPSGSRCASAPGRPNFSATTPRRPRRGRGAGRRRPGGRPGRSRRRGRDRRQPDAVLCRVGRPGRRHRHRSPARGSAAEVTDTQKKADGLFVHVGRSVEGEPEVGAAVELEVDHARRRGSAPTIRPPISSTRRLREVLGDHVAQKGSLVAPDRLRFDFSHPKPIGRRDSTRSSAVANRVVRDNAEVTTRLMSVDDAIAEGARALFGEKYGDEVRVVAMGRSADGTKPFYSIELCGGTHVGATGDIGLVRLVSESAVAAGVRRIEALTGEAARRHLDEQERRLKAVAAALKVPPADAPARVEALVEERRRLERELAEARKQLALGGGAAAGTAEAETVAGVGFLGRASQGVAPKDLKPLADAGKKSLGSGVVVFVGAADDGKASVVVGVTDDLTGRFSAVDLVRRASAALGGQGGGGRADMAQAGGPDASKAGAAIAAVKSAMRAA